MEVLIDAAHLRAAALATSKQDIRYYLNGVLVEVSETETRLVATNGHVAAILRSKSLEGAQPVFNIIVPNEVIAMVAKIKEPLLVLANDNGRWSLAGVVFTPIDSTFPPYRRIIPSTASGEAAQFSLEYLAIFGKMAKALGVKSNPVIRHNGEGRAQVQVVGREDEFVGVIMPLRAFSEKHPDPGLCQWGRE